MAITSVVSDNGNLLTISVTGRFDFSSHHDFCETYKDVEPKPAHYCVDMKETIYIDSSALGMLLLLHDYAGDSCDIKIVNCKRDIKDILTVSNFEQLFTIE